MALTVYTSGPRYAGWDQFSVAAYGGNATFAPSKEIIYGLYTNVEFCYLYIKLLEESQELHPERWAALLARERVTLVEFNSPTMFCHRRVLAAVLVELGATYGGELDET